MKQVVVPRNKETLIMSFLKNYLYFTLGFIAPFWFFIIYFFLKKNVLFQNRKPPLSWPIPIALFAYIVLAIVFFGIYYLWIKFRLSVDFKQLKWYSYTISGLLILIFLFIAIYIPIVTDIAKTIDKSSCSTFWYISIVFLPPILSGEIILSLKKYFGCREQKIDSKKR